MCNEDNEHDGAVKGHQAEIFSRFRLFVRCFWAEWELCRFIGRGAVIKPPARPHILSLFLSKQATALSLRNLIHRVVSFRVE
jgi:hypothetical protein